MHIAARACFQDWAAMCSFVKLLIIFRHKCRCQDKEIRKGRSVLPTPVLLKSEFAFALSKYNVNRN